MFAIFTVVSSEMMPVGLLTAVAHGLGVSGGVTGLSLTGLIAAALAPFTPRLVARRERRAVLVTFMVLLGPANALSALAPNFAVLAVGRILLGAAMGIVRGLVTSLGPRLAEGPRIGLAMTLIFSGVSIASVLGVPLGTFLAALLDWRFAFWTLAALGAACAAVVPVLPAPPVPEGGRTAGRAGRRAAPPRRGRGNRRHRRRARPLRQLHLRPPRPRSRRGPEQRRDRRLPAGLRAGGRWFHPDSLRPAAHPAPGHSPQGQEAAARSNSVTPSARRSRSSSPPRE
ncbi:MFS transporter [Kitasatospora sp. NPDC087315]|uniref:MFS transporter n=1 Tax=Kitasatospora sp. NPDC087315 TaxID=3364069 RepID=UPI0037F5075B